MKNCALTWRQTRGQPWNKKGENQVTGFEESLKALAMKMTGATALDIPGDMEGIIQYMADNLQESGGPEKWHL